MLRVGMQGVALRADIRRANLLDKSLSPNWWIRPHNNTAYEFFLTRFIADFVLVPMLRVDIRRANLLDKSLSQACGYARIITPPMNFF